MESTKRASPTEPDWLALTNKVSDWQQHHRGWLAELKRVKECAEVADLPAYYRLIQGAISPGKVAERATFLLPWLSHRADAPTLGAQFRSAKISEMRLFQVLRAESPGDLVLLRRLIQQAKPSVNWADFGKAMQYWGQKQKRQLLQDYFLNTTSSQDKD